MIFTEIFNITPNMKQLLNQLTKRIINAGTALRALPFAVFIWVSMANGAFAQVDITVGMDPNFLKTVRKETGISSGPIYSTDTRVTSLTELGVNDSYIASLAGIEYFTALEVLDCMSNYLTALDVSALTSLKELYCNINSLTALDVSALTALEKLDCYANRLTALNVSALTALKWLNCSANRLTALDVAGLSALERLECDDNALTALNVSKLAALDNLDCSNNLLTALNVSGLTGMRYLKCRNNRLANGALNIAGCKLVDLECDYNSMTPVSAPGASSIAGYVSGKNPATGFKYNPQNASGFRPVTGIKGIPQSVAAGAAFDLSAVAEVFPADATNRTIVWSISDGSATVGGHTLTPPKTGGFTLRATIADGMASGTPYTYEFRIDARPPVAPVGSPKK
jgi:hypothetical protein